METTQMLYLAGAFVLGFIVAWFAGRSGPKRGLEECEANAHSLQRTLDDRTRSISKLEGQLKEQIAQVDRLGSEKRELSTSLQSAEQTAAAQAEEIAALQMQMGQTQSDKLLLESELGHMRGAYSDTRTRLAELFAQAEAQAEEAAASAEAENTALAVAEAGRAADVEQLSAQVQSLEIELEAVRANSARLAGQVALRPQLSSTQQQEYAALAGNPERVVAALHERDMAVADARAEAEYLRRTVGMLTGMGAELAGEVERRRREQQLLLYQVAGLNAVTREIEMRQLVDRQAQPVQAADAQPGGTPAGTIEPEGHDLPVGTRPDNGLEGAGQESDDTDLVGATTAMVLDLSTQLDERSKELEELRAQSEPLQANLDELQAQIEALSAANADLEAQLESRDGNLQEMQNTVGALQLDAEGAAAAKAALAEKLQLHGAAWSSLIERVKALNSEIEAIVAAEPDAEPVGSAGEAPSDELAALAATAPVEQAVPEAARAADAALPPAEASGEAASGEAAAGAEAGEADGVSAEGKAVLDKLAAGVLAAAMLFQRKNAKLAEAEEQINSLTADLTADQSALEATATAKAELETQLETRGSELSELQTRLGGLQTEVENSAAAKAALAEKLQMHGGAWQSLLERIGELNANLEGLIAAEPVADEPAESAPAEAAATAVAGEADVAAAPPAVEAVTGEAATGEAGTGEAGTGEAVTGEPVTGEAAVQEDEELLGARTAVKRLAAGVTAALAIVGRKNARLADFEQQVGALAGEKSTLESTLAAKDQSLVAAQAQVEQLQTGISQRATRFDALSMHASSMEADMEIKKLERAKLEEQVRAVAAGLQALLKPQANGDAPEQSVEQSGDHSDEEVVVAAGAEAAAQPEAAQPAAQSSLEELAAAATAVVGLVRSKDGALLDARTQLTGLQAQLADYESAKEALAAELESRGVSMADVETRLQSLQSEYSGAQSTQTELRATLMSLGEELDAYLAEYGQADDAPAPAAEDAEASGAVAVAAEGAEASGAVAVDAAGAEDANGEAALSARATRAVAAVTAIGVLLRRRKDALESANARIGELESEISALTSQKSELDAQAEQQAQALAALTEQLAAAQADAEAQRAEVATLSAQVSELTAQKEALDAQTAEREQAMAELTAQLATAETGLAERTMAVETLTYQLSALQAQADATEQERVRLDAQWHSLNDDLAQFGAALDAGDDATVESLNGAMAQRLGASLSLAATTAAEDGAEAGAVAQADRSLAAPLVKTAGALTLVGVARKKLQSLKATSAELAALQEEHAALLDRKSELESQLEQESAALEQTKAQLAAIETELSEARAQHMEELQVLDAKSAELQSQYNEAESNRLQLETSLASLHQELDQLGAVLESDDGWQQFAQTRSGAVEVDAGADAETPAEGVSEDGPSATRLVGVAAVAAALGRKQAALQEADARVAAMQAQLDELSADREAAKTLLADRDQALQEVESKLTEVTLQAEKTVSDFKAAARAAAEARGLEVQTTNVLQDFAQLKHIGVTFEQRLYRAGAGTFWEVAHLTDEDFALILRLTEMQQLAMNLDETRSDAVRLAEETGALGMISAGERPDDFEPIQGIGKVFEQRLYSAGIRTYWDMANSSEERLAEICKARKPLVPDYASWIRQARILAEVQSGS